MTRVELRKASRRCWTGLGLDEDGVQFFAQLASLLPAVKDTSFQDSCDIDIPESQHFWRRVLKWLVNRNHWRGVYCQDLGSWGICLGMWLLKQGARIEFISSDEGESLTIAAVKTSLKAGVSELLSFVMEKSLTTLTKLVTPHFVCVSSSSSLMQSLEQQLFSRLFSTWVAVHL